MDAFRAREMTLSAADIARGCRSTKKETWILVSDLIW